MRNVVIFDNRGMNYNCQYYGVCDVDKKKFLKEFFYRKGEIVCVPLLESLIVTFEKFYPNDKNGLEKLKSVEDSYNIHLIFNSLLFKNEECDNNIVDKKWNVNDFITKLYGREIFAEPICLLVAASELEGVNEVTEDEYIEFIKKIYEIIRVNNEVLEYDYFNSLTYFLDNDNIITSIDRNDVKEVKSKYDNGEYILFPECIFLNKENENPLILRKNGVIMFVNENNDCEIFFDAVRNSKEENPFLYVEKIC